MPPDTRLIATGWTFMDDLGSTQADRPAPAPDESDATRAATERDRAADEHDELARRRDARTDTIDEGISTSNAPLASQIEWLRAQAPVDRRRAAGDIRTAAADRRRAADDRRTAADDLARAAGDLADLKAELRHANLDNLTGAYRRDMGTVALTRQIARAGRGNRPFVIAFVDVDGLKQVNDRDGHAAGDKVLESLVSHMRSNLRAFDPVVRYGGDEFLAGMAGLSLTQAGRRFELIDQSLRLDVGVGISVGLAELEPDETLDELTARADALLLDAKTSRVR